MTVIRDYVEENDAQEVGVLIANTYRKFNLGFASPSEQEKLLGPFRHAGSSDPIHQEAITRILRTEMVFVAEDEGRIAGVLRCRPGRLQSLFVGEDYHHRGIGRKLVERCEQECARRGSTSISLAATLYAVPFYQAVGYKKSTGVRTGRSFDGEGLKYQPMKKALKAEPVIDIGIQGCSIRPLSPVDSPVIQHLYDQCLDYMLLVDGHPAGPNAGEEEFKDVPPGKSPKDKYIFGIFDQSDQLLGLLDALRGYPDETTWWIGLLLLLPEARTKGLGRLVVQGFTEYVWAKGGKAIMLGVVEENERAFQFWTRLGFEVVHRTEPRQFGNKMQTVNIMRLIPSSLRQMQ
jgi:GNAT superfamily N-acetyltransferase